MNRRRRAWASAGALVVAFAAASGGSGRAGLPLPPWVEEGEVPPPAWARSVVPKSGERGAAGDLTLFAGPSRTSGRRGVTAKGAGLPFFGVKRGSGCTGRWWLVGPLAWACSDDADLSAEAEQVPTGASAGGSVEPLAEQYFFVTHEGASGYASVEAAQEGAPDRELEGGWAVGVVEQRSDGADHWLRTSKGLWLAARDLAPARPSAFRGEAIPGDRIDFAWVRTDSAGVWREAASKTKPVDAHARFEVVHIVEDRGAMVRVGDNAWMLTRDLARPASSPPPPELSAAGEHWIDVDLASQTLVAYEGARPVYATLVSTGRGAPGSASATPPGTHRIWVKLVASDMDNVERDDVEDHYSMEDVPYVQFFDGAVALHGTYWHGDFGRVHSHGCVNLAPLDAKWLFAFSSPRLPAGWAAAYPTPLDLGTLVRVR